MFKELHIYRQIRSAEMKLQVEAKRVCSLGNNQFQFAWHNQFVFLWLRTICIIIIFYNLLSCKVTERTIQGWENTERLSFWPISVFCNFSQPAQIFHPRGVRPHLEGKPRTPLSFWVAMGISWSPLSGLRESGLLFSLERGLGIALWVRQEKKALTSRGRGLLRGFLEL